jgi:hypothetical protein
VPLTVVVYAVQACNRFPASVVFRNKDANCKSVWRLGRDECEFAVHETLLEWCASAAVSMNLRTRLV